MIFTSEQVSKGHPDKICDQVSDAILTECLREDPDTRAGIECLIKGKHLTVAGEISTKSNVNIEKIARQIVAPLMEEGDSIQIHNYLSVQSKDIALGVDNGGAGDQGMMFGYACRETEEMMPLTWAMSTRALQMLDQSKKDFLLADAKSQVSYDTKDDYIDTFLISVQHTEQAKGADIENICYDIVKDVCDFYNKSFPKRVLINPTGRFVIGGPYADAGVTGRKIIADTYGGYCPHGGGAFSGKDPTKVDRSGAYAARKIAKDILRMMPSVNECMVQIAYAIGIDEPVSIYVAVDGKPAESMSEWVKKNYDLTPLGIIKYFNLKNFNYNLVSTYGHFGKKNLPWEE